MQNDPCPHCQERADLIKANEQAQRALTDQQDVLNAIRARVLAFVSQLQAWGHTAAANELTDEILIGPVHAPDYFEMQTENAALRDTATQYKALFEDMEGARQDAERDADTLIAQLEQERMKNADLHVEILNRAEKDAEDTQRLRRYCESKIEEYRDYREYWEPRIKDLSDLYTRQGGELATMTVLLRDLVHACDQAPEVGGSSGVFPLLFAALARARAAIDGDVR